MIDSFVAGTLAGAGSFRCGSVGFPTALHERDEIPAYPHCHAGRFRRASIFGDHTPAEPIGTHEVEHPTWLSGTRAGLDAGADYLAFSDEDEIRVVPLEEGWTRLGRS